MVNNHEIIILSYYHYPCDEPVLENVFAKELGKHLKITFLMQGDISKGQIQKWHNSNVILTKLFNENFLQTRILNKFYALKKLIILFKILKTRDTKIMLVRDLPLETILLSVIKKFFKFKLYFQYSAPLGDINIGYFKNNKTIKRYWYLINGYYYKFLVYWAIHVSDLIFPITIFFYTEFKLPKNDRYIVPLTMGFDHYCLERNKSEIKSLKCIKENNNYILIYFGTLNYNRNPEIFLEILFAVLKEIPNCVLLLIGKTVSEKEKQLLLKRCGQLKLKKKVIFTEHISRERLYDHLQYCDISISAVPPEYYYRISSPTKLYESLGHGVPVIANEEILEQKKVIKESGGGLVVKYDIQEFSQAIIGLLRNEKLRMELGRKGKRYILENYTYYKLSKNIFTKFL
jgi:glycosyltransferase involved in cell wall biosynthesis